MADRITFVMYFVCENSLIRREGEARCRKIGDEGVPRVRVSNAQWDPEFRELEFDLRSSCYLVELLGGGSNRTLNLALGKVGYDSNFSKPGSWVDEGQRVIVAFDPRGDAFGIEVAKAHSANRISTVVAGSGPRRSGDGERRAGGRGAPPGPA
jgi:hypothetical protein